MQHESMWHVAWVMGAYTRAAAADLRFDRPSGWAGQLATLTTTTAQRVPVVAKLTATAPGRDCVCACVPVPLGHFSDKAGPAHVQAQQEQKQEQEQLHEASVAFAVN